MSVTVVLVFCLACGASRAAARLVPTNVDSAGAPAPLPPFRTDYRYSDDAGYFYRIHREPVEWKVARDRCQDESASLPSSLSRRELLALLSIKLDAANFSRGLESVWLDPCGEACSADRPGTYLAADLGVIAAASTAQRLPSVCVRSAAAVTKDETCGALAPGYELGPNGTSCYKFHTWHYTFPGASWGEAQLACQAEGAHLAIIDDRAEADHLVALMKGKVELNLVAVGFHSLFSPDVFHTVRGDLMGGYQEWAVGQPDKSNNKHCVFMSSSSGRLSNTICEQEMAYYVCEREVDTCRHRVSATATRVTLPAGKDSSGDDDVYEDIYR